MTRLTAEVSRGPEKHTILTPHRYGDGRFVVSKTRFESDYKWVSEAELLSHVKRGFSVRMSDPITRRSPRLIRPKSIRITLGENG